MSKHGAYYISTEKEYELFYSCSSQEHRCVGHLRGYFSGDCFYTRWFPHENEEALNKVEDLLQNWMENEVGKTIQNFLRKVVTEQ